MPAFQLGLTDVRDWIANSWVVDWNITGIEIDWVATLEHGGGTLTRLVGILLGLDLGMGRFGQWLLLDFDLGVVIIRFNRRVIVLVVLEVTLADARLDLLTRAANILDGLLVVPRS